MPFDLRIPAWLGWIGLLPCWFGCGPGIGGFAPSRTPLTAASTPPATDAVHLARWPCFRGPGGQGRSPCQDVATHFGPAEQVRWRQPLTGQGRSSPIAWDGRVYLTAVRGGSPHDPGPVLELICTDLNSGLVRWKQELPLDPASTAGLSAADLAASTPCTDGTLVVVQCGRVLAAWDPEGHLAWQVPLAGAMPPRTVASSPLCHGNLVYCACPVPDGTRLEARHLATGRPAWHAVLPGGPTWSTPVIRWLPLTAGTWQAELLLHGAGGGTLAAFDPATGRPLWQAGTTSDMVCPLPLIQGSRIISSSGRNGPVFCLDRPAGGPARLAWQHPAGGSFVPSGLIVDGRVLLVSDSGTVFCHSLATGGLQWRKRLGEPVSASLVAAEDRIYAAGDLGRVHVFRAGDAFELLAVNDLGEPCLATPAIAGGNLLFRTETALVCVAPQVAVAAGPAADAVSLSPSDAITAGGQPLPD